jgi:hypothetical protein
MTNVKFTCASTGESAQTIRTAQFEGIKFRYGQQYKIVLANGSALLARVNRKDASTLYIASKDFPKTLKLALVGTPVHRKVKNIFKV